MVGFLTSRKVYHTSFFVCDCSYCIFAHHQETTSAEETTIAKQACESDLRKYVKKVTRYDAGNGTSPVVKYKEEIEDKKKTLTFCSVDIRHQNGKA